MDEPETDIPEELRDPPSGSLPAPPIETVEQVLPVGQLPPENFERLCLRMAHLEGDPIRSRRFGVEGQKQFGIDIYSRLPSGRFATYQCKRYQTIDPADVAAAVSMFTAGTWARKSKKFVLATSASADRTEVEEEIEAQTELLAALNPPVEFEVWDQEEISRQLRRQRGIVEQFFGPHWLRRFFGEHAAVLVEGGVGDLRAIVRSAVLEAQAPRLVSNDWAPPRLRPTLDDLQADDPKLFEQICERFGNPPDAERLRAEVRQPSAWLLDQGDETWMLVARIAGALGQWPAASEAWEQAAARQQGVAAARSLAQGASCADVIGDEPTTERLLEQAEGLDPVSVSVALMRLTDAISPPEQLRILEPLDSDDAEEVGLLSARRAIASLLLPDPEAARRELEQVGRHIPGSWLIPGLEVSIVVQEARLAKLDQTSLDRGALQRADELAKETRTRLIAEQRYSEATRLLMLRADLQALLGDREEASRVLRTATGDDLATQEQKEVLADSAASRALDASLALRFLENADETPITQRIRLESQVDVGTPGERAAALEGLEAIVISESDQAPHAAFVRLAATLGPQLTPWSEAAAVLLRKTGHERAAMTAEAMFISRQGDIDAVERLLRPYRTTPWAQSALLHAALNPRADAAAAARAAETVLAAGASYELRVDAAKAFGRIRDFPRVRQELAGVARDPNAPDAVRADAYSLLMDAVGEQLGDWEGVAQLYYEWIALRPSDPRSYKWGPAVASRRRSG